MNIIASWVPPLVFVASMMPTAATGGCLVVTDVSGVHPVDATRLMLKTAGSEAFITLTGCFMTTRDVAITLRRDPVCVGDMIGVDHLQCMVRSIESTSVGQVQRLPAPAPAPPPGGSIPQVAPVLRKP